MLSGDWRLHCEASPANYSAIESQLYSLAGRYVLILLGKDIQRIYVDPSASLSVLYSIDEQVAGSTATALGVADPSPLATQISRTRRASGTWYPCGLTEWRSLHVLLPNHYLDLRSWVARRHWPECDAPFPSESCDTSATIREICQRLANNIAAVVSEHLATMELTAGRDTRMLLACSKPLVEKIQFETSPTHSATDVDISVKMATLFKLNHHIGQPVNLRHALLQGAAGEVGRAFYWRRSDHQQVALSGVGLAERMHFPDATFVPQLQDWLNELPRLSSFAKLDLLYVEQRLAMAHAPANYERDCRFAFTLFPLSDRRIFELMMSLPPSYRLRQALCPAICKVRWPELNLFPINSPYFEGIGLEKYRKLLEQSFFKALNREQRSFLRKETFRTGSLVHMIIEDVQKVWRRLLRST